MATVGLYGSVPNAESVGLYGNNNVFGGTYFEWFIFQVGDTQPATPTGGSWDFTTNIGTPPTGWLASPPANPTNTVWVSVGLVNSKSTVAIAWSAPGKFSYSAGLPILSGTASPSAGDGVTDQLYIQTSTTPETIWFKQVGTWTRITGSTLYMDLTNSQTIAGTKTFSSPIAGSVTGTSANVTGIVAVANGGTGVTTSTGSNSVVLNTSPLLITPTLSGATVDNAAPYLNFTPTTAPAYQEGRVFYDSSAHTLNYYNDNSQMSVNIGQENVIRVRNQTGSTIPEGSVVYINGATGNTPTISLAIATAFATADIIGVATTTIANNGFGYATTSGLVNDLNLSAFTEGQAVFVSPTTPGAFTATEPVAPNYSVQVGVVLRANPSNGTLLVSVQMISTEVSHIVGTMLIGQGGTGQTTANAAFNALAPSQTGNTGKYLTTDGSNTSWATNPLGTVTSVAATVPSFLSITGSPITTSGTLAFGLSGTALPTTSGGTNLTSFTANGVVYASSTSALATGSALTFDGTNFVVNNGYIRANNTLGYYTTLTATGLTNFATSMDFDSVSDYIFKRNSTEQMRLTSIGLGIGTSSPTRRISAVNTSSGGPIIEITGSGGAGNELGFGVDTTGGYFQQLGSKPISFYTGGSERMRLDSAGNLGLGTSTAPSTNGGGIAIYKSDYPRLTFRNSSTGDTNTVGVQFAAVGSNFEIYNKSSGYIDFGTGNVSRMLLDTNGNLGLGVTPSAWNSTTKAIQVGDYGAFSWNGYEGGTVVGNNVYQSASTTEKYIATGVAPTKYRLSGGSHAWYSAASGTAGAAISFTQAMTLDASGNLYVGGTTGAFGGSQKGISAQSGSVITVLNGESDNSIGSTGTITNHPFTFKTNGSERARIDASGNLLVGTTSAISNGKISVSFSGAASGGANFQTTTTDANTINFINSSGTAVGRIYQDNTSTSYVTSSDYRLKDITGPITTSGAYIDSLNPVEGTWKADGSTFVGLLAHEAQEASRTVVATGVKDGEQMQGMDYSSAEIIANLIAEIQNLRKRLAAAGI